MSDKLTVAELLGRAASLAASALDEAKSTRPANVQSAGCKVWMAARMMATAVVAHCTGERPKGTATVLAVLDRLADRDERVELIGSLVGKAFEELHLKCTETGICDRKTVERVAFRLSTRTIPLAAEVCCVTRYPAE